MAIYTGQTYASRTFTGDGDTYVGCTFNGQTWFTGRYCTFIDCVFDAQGATGALRMGIGPGTVHHNLWFGCTFTGAIEENFAFDAPWVAWDVGELTVTSIVSDSQLTATWADQPVPAPDTYLFFPTNGNYYRIIGVAGNVVTLDTTRWTTAGLGGLVGKVYHAFADNEVTNCLCDAGDPLGGSAPHVHHNTTAILLYGAAFGNSIHHNTIRGTAVGTATNLGYEDAGGSIFGEFAATMTGQDNSDRNESYYTAHNRWCHNVIDALPGHMGWVGTIKAFADESSYGQGAFTNGVQFCEFTNNTLVRGTMHLVDVKDMNTDLTVGERDDTYQFFGDDGLFGDPDYINWFGPELGSPSGNTFVPLVPTTFPYDLALSVGGIDQDVTPGALVLTALLGEAGVSTIRSYVVVPSPLTLGVGAPVSSVSVVNPGVDYYDLARAVTGIDATVVPAALRLRAFLTTPRTPTAPDHRHPGTLTIIRLGSGITLSRPGTRITMSRRTGTIEVGGSDDA